MRLWTEAQKNDIFQVSDYKSQSVWKLSTVGYGIIISLEGFEINNCYVPINIGFVLECSFRLPSKQKRTRNGDF